VRLTSESEEPVEIVLKVNGEKKVTTGDFEVPPEITIANPKEHIMSATDKKLKFEMRCTVEQGRGYAPAENQAGKEQNIGTIAIDAIFSPVQRGTSNKSPQTAYYYLDRWYSFSKRCIKTGSFNFS
jgi:DNA-directed RNA polymerase subunit alpha